MGNFDLRLKIVIYILFFNFILASIYLVVSMIKKDYKKGFMMTGFIILAPVVGPIYLASSSLIYQLYFKNRREILNIEELSLRKDKIELIVRDDIESALNKVPIEEALIVSSDQNTRRLILNVLKENTRAYITSISGAIDNRDGEVSHYAASALTDIMDKFKEKEKILRKSYNEDRGNIENAQIYWGYISEFLKTDVLPRVEQERYLKLLAELTKKLEENNENIVTGEMYYIITSLSIDLGKIDKSRVWADKALKTRPNDLYSYKAALKFYYESKNVDKYKKTLKELMDSSIRLDNETLELIRFYNH